MTFGPGISKEVFADPCSVPDALGPRYGALPTCPKETLIPLRPTMLATAAVVAALALPAVLQPAVAQASNLACIRSGDQPL